MEIIASRIKVEVMASSSLVLYRMSPKDIKLISQGLLYIFLNILEPFSRVFGWSFYDEIVAGKALLLSYRWQVERLQMGSMDSASRSPVDSLGI